MIWFRANAPKCTVTARTHVGCVRSQNEDSFLVNSTANLYVVADGMGGYEMGEAASQIICECLSKLGKSKTLSQLIASIEQGVDTAHQQILKFSEEKCEGRTIGSTIVGFAANDEGGACIWAGDSRLYRLRDRQLTQLSRDHSQVAELARLGLITPEQAKRHPHANLITRAVGTGEKTTLEIELVDIAPNDRFLLCTDGLHNELGDQELCHILQNFELELAADKLLASCLEKGARDNVTLMLIQVQ